MPSSLTWLDHDAAASEKSMQLLHFFRVSEARDELGIGGIRDAISDQLFPGTSTIPTRLRYFFFVPWIFAELEGRRIADSKFGEMARQAEAGLQDQLVRQEPEDEPGIIGRTRGSLLKRMPSSVYWSGLQSWDLRRFDGSLQNYMGMHERRKALAARGRGTDDRDDTDTTLSTWDASLLKLCPDGFPKEARLALTSDEAQLLMDKWHACHPRSLLTWLAHRLQREVSAPQVVHVWEHPFLAEFPEHLRVLVKHGKCLDAATRGAAYLYNLLLAELEESRRPELADEYRGKLANWAQTDLPLLQWNLDSFWPMVMGKGHAITTGTQSFLRSWLTVARAESGQVADSAIARRLIMERERSIKKSRSRFDNAAARKQWGGSAGTGHLDFRWRIASGYLDEWHAAWRRQ